MPDKKEKLIPNGYDLKSKVKKQKAKLKKPEVSGQKGWNRLRRWLKISDPSPHKGDSG
jgi:hypothetical protein